MSHELHVIPDASHTAAKNMAHDFLLLNRYSPADALRIRHYGWIRPAFTFGLSQSFSYIQSEITDPSAEICRRPTGGGVVNHQEDWTYALVIPASHPLGRSQPVETYKIVHDCMIAAMTDQGCDVILNLDAPNNSTPGVCFNKSEVYDVVLRNFPSKVAGAAQKRSKAGYLMQGSIWKPILPDIEWNRFYNDFILEIAKVAEAEIQFESWPQWSEEEEHQLIEQFESDDWNKKR
jgi:lipoyl(octanoyl) transferase